MKANMDRLIDAANAAAEACLVINSGASLAIIVSCVGRKLVLGERIAEESRNCERYWEAKQY
jgi:hypothetical protein